MQEQNETIYQVPKISELKNKVLDSSSQDIVSNKKSETFYRIPRVSEETGLAKSTIYWMIANDKFPKQLKISERVSVWKKSDIDRWIEEQINAVESIGA